MARIECDDCGKLKECTMLFSMYFCDDCNARVYADIDSRIKNKKTKIDDML